jgi:hypothetical protein
MSATHRIVGPNVIERRVDMERAWHRAFENYFKPLGVEVRWTNYTVRPATNLGEGLRLLQSVMLHSVQEGQHARVTPGIPRDGKPLLCQPSSTLLFAGPVGTFLRASMRAVDEQVLMYQKKGVGPRTNLTMGTVFNQTAYLQQLVTAEVCLFMKLQCPVTGIEEWLAQGV